MRVADSVTKMYAFSTYCTLSHEKHLLLNYLFLRTSLTHDNTTILAKNKSFCKHKLKNFYFFGFSSVLSFLSFSLSPFLENLSTNPGTISSTFVMPS